MNSRNNISDPVFLADQSSMDYPTQVCCIYAGGEWTCSVIPSDDCGAAGGRSLQYAGNDCASIGCSGCMETNGGTGVLGYVIIFCDDNTVAFVDDTSAQDYGTNINDGDFVYMDASDGSSSRCAEVIKDQYGPSGGLYLDGNDETHSLNSSGTGFSSCSDCTSNAGGGGGGGNDIYSCTDCSDNSTILIEDTGNISPAPSNGDIVMVTDGSTYKCVTVGSTTSGSASYEFDSAGFTDCSDCEQYL